ncbi:MAG: class I SAM-dependent methyltransferase [Hyphomicrobiales bacterium]|nr:class I SAM-dependent methyltransferase [Hyphomicrobiales bacterium]
MTPQELTKITLRNKFFPLPPAYRNQSFKDSDVIKSGLDLTLVLIKYGLTQKDRVLDLGCGYGRVALPLTQYLNHDASYLGLDINLGAVAWCHENINQRYENFEFSVINAKNDHYRNKFEYGNQSLKDSFVPLPSYQFDYIFSFSLFTHLTHDDATFYIRLVSEKLKPGGQFLSTWFLINEEKMRGVASGDSLFKFQKFEQFREFRLSDKYSEAIGFDEADLLSEFEASGLSLTEKIYQNWHRGKAGQDVLVATKAG